ncbi:MAG: hypothetical protein GYB66_11075 [Chloroflexi bacterium]|nr:hypothetical protein [Chloroflexota bacterium]
MRPFNLSIQRPQAEPWLVAIFLILMTLLVAFGAQGFEHGSVNNFSDQSIQLPIIYSYADPALFTDDFLIAARDSYVTFFYPAIGFGSRFVSLELLMLGLYVASVGITVGAIYALAETLFPRRYVGMVAVLLWMAFLPNIGGDFIHSPFVTHSTFAIALALWALVMIFRGQYTGAAVLLGLITNINAMTSFFVTFMWAFAVVTNPREWSWRLVRIPIIMFIAALPVLWWRFSLPLVEASLDTFVNIVRMRLWYAVFPFSISTILWIGFFGLVLLWLYSFRYGKPQQHNKVLRMILGISILCTIGTVFSEVIPVEFIIELQLIRSGWLINLLITFYIANMIRELLVSRRPREAFSAFLLVALLAAPRIAIEFLPMTHPTPYQLYVDFDTSWAREYGVMYGAALVLLIVLSVWVVWQLIQHKIGPTQPVFTRRVVAWFGFSAVIFALLPGLLETEVPSDQMAQTSAWEETLIWVENNTPKDARFMAPPTMDGFRTIAQRSHIGDWKDGTVGIFNNGWAIEWYDLMLDMGFDEDRFAFETMTPDRLCYVASKYETDYAVVDLSWDITGEPVYQNDQFAVVETDATTCPERMVKQP